MNRKFGLVLALIVCSLSAAYALATEEAAQHSSKHLHGIWLWKNTDYRETLNLSIQRKGTKWTARVDSVQVDVTEHDGNIAFVLADGQRFEGNLSNNNALEGSWFQPPAAFGYYAEMATIVSLDTISAEQWQGIIHIQPRPFHLFLDIFDDSEGVTKAVVRNPEGNEILGSTVFEVSYLSNTANTQHWQLIAQRRNREITVPFTFSDNQTIRLEHFLVPEPVALHRANASELQHYYSRMPDERDFQPSKVIKLNDGWNVGNAVEAGFNPEVLSQLIKKLASADPRSRRPQLLHSLLVSYRGKLVLEEYFYGHDKGTVHDTRSVGKIFGSILIGAAQQQGYEIKPSDTPLPKILKSAGRAVPDNKTKITLEHFLTHTSGLDAIEDEQSKGSESKLWQQSENYWLYTAKLDVLHPPGQRYAYASASANMVGAALRQATAKPVRTLFHEMIAEPMNFAPYHWNLTPQGNSYLGGGVYMRPRDLLKLGALYAANGKWHDKQIVPEQWVALSTTAKIDISPETTGLNAEAFSNNYGNGAKQAYIWLLNPIAVNDRVYDSYSATGNGGQMIVVVPELDLAVGFTGGNYRMGGIWSRWRQQIIGDYLIPAIQH